MLKGKDIIIVGQQAWDIDIGSNCKNIALELSKYNRVLYVNAPLDRITKIRSWRDPKVKKRIDIINKKATGLEKVQDNLWILYPDVLIESINWIRLGSLFSFFNLRNNKRFCKAIIQALDTLRFSNYLLFNDNDIFRSFYLKELLKPELSIYYIRDYMVATPYWKRHGTALEPKLIEKSDLVLANSEYLRQYSAKYNGNSYFVGQGCDFALLKQADLNTPEDMINVEGPIIGYFGVLTAMRLDECLIRCISELYPDYKIVLVGPEDEIFRKSKLHDCSNVIFLGSKPPEYIFKYINAFDVCINPQILNELTIGNYPRKIDEYLAMGKPVVALDTDAMTYFKDHVYLASSKKAFVEQIDVALNAHDNVLSDNRKKFALSHTWINSVNMISNTIINHQVYVNRTLNNGA